MSFSPSGYPVMACSGVIAIGVLALSVYRRSWSFWLVGYALLVAAAVVAWVYRGPGHDTTAAQSTLHVVASAQSITAEHTSSGVTP